MKNSADNHFLLIGLPGTGKTSFLAALWYMVSLPDVSGLVLERLDGDSQYLNEIRSAWLKYKPVPRNSADSEQAASMLLNHRETGRAGRLSFPDLSGEAFRSQWSQRQLTHSYDRNLHEATGGVLFVHPDNMIRPQRIDVVNAALESMGVDEQQKKPKVKVSDWDEEKAEKSPTQVQLVDILQFMAARNDFRRPFRLAIVVSAWDRIVHNNRKPSEWISTELPLLKQFLDSNDDLFAVAFFGISAQGARYALPHFWSGNFENCQPFAERVCTRGDAISAWIWDKLTPSSHTTLELLRQGDTPTKLQKTDLAKNFNEIMGLPDIYEETRFATVELRSETEDLLERVTRKEDERLYVSRLLLEDAYPELSRDREHAAEASELQDRPPAHRVLVVGESVKMRHDITEPIQWLMH